MKTKPREKNRLMKRFTLECGDLLWKGNANTIEAAFKKARYSFLPKVPELSLLCRFRIDNGDWYYQHPVGIIGSESNLKKLLRIKVAPKKPDDQFSYKSQ